MSLSSRSHAISVAIIVWDGEHCVFVIETYLENGDSIIATQRLFRRHFGVDQHGRVPDRKTILLWVGNFRETGSALKQKSSGRPCRVRTPENIAAVGQAITTSPRCSVIKHALALGICDQSVRRILHTDLKFHPYKMMVVQEFGEGDWLSHQPSWKMFQLMLMCCLVMLIFICQAASTSRIFGIWPQTILNNSMSDLSTVSVLLFGVVLRNLE
jgi:transposase